MGREIPSPRPHSESCLSSKTADTAVGGSMGVVVVVVVSCQCQHSSHTHTQTGRHVRDMDGTGYGNPDRGWNDPPKLAFCPTRTGTPAGSGRHRLLNKRVPIPINVQSSTTPSTQPPSLKAGDGPPVKSGVPLHPPPVSACLPPSTTTSVACASATQNVGGPLNTPATQELLEQVHTSLSDSIKNMSEKIKESTYDEIKKRLDVMVDMWQKDQLSLEVQKRMLTLTEALSKQDYDKAWALHQSLIVDYTTTCSPWMVGIKTLIAESRSPSELVPEHQEVESNKESEAEEDTLLDGDEGESSVSNESSIK